MRTKNENGESGQALTEMAVSLVVIVSLLLGFFLIASAGLQNVKNAIIVREEADKGGNSTTSMASIAFPDDETSYVNGSLFTTQLISNGGEVNLVTDKETKYGNKFYSMSDYDTMLDAADLSYSARSVNDPMGEYGLTGTETAARKLFGVENITIKDELYMPHCQHKRND